MMNSVQDKTVFIFQYKHMSSCNFTITFSGRAIDVINSAKAAIEGNGGTFNGNLSGGTFSVKVFISKVRGSFNISGQEINVKIDSKPIMITCNQIENYMKNSMNIT